MIGRATATATSYEESVGSWGPPTPHTPPAPAAPRSTPVRRQLDFTAAGDLEDDDDEFLCRVADDIERGYSEAKLRAPRCVCGRDVCAVERDDQSGRWKYVCSSVPKCKHVAFYEEVDLDSKSLPTSRSHPKPSKPCAFNDPSNPCAVNNPRNHMTGPRTPVNGGCQVTGAITPVHICPQVAGDTTTYSDNPQGAGVTTLVNFSPHAERPASPAKVISQGVVTTNPATVSPQGAGMTTLVNFSPHGGHTASPAKVISQGVVVTTPAKVSPQGQGARSKFETPICQCTAGECRKITIAGEEWYVCHIPKKKGACSYKVRVSDFAEVIAPSLQQRPIAEVNTPSKSPMRPNGTPSPISPNSDYICYRCHKAGHNIKDCPEKSPRDNACFKCHMVGHWWRDCPQPQGS